MLANTEILIVSAFELVASEVNQSKQIDVEALMKQIENADFV
jgi:hypothetical protein